MWNNSKLFCLFAALLLGLPPRSGSAQFVSAVSPDLLLGTPGVVDNTGCDVASFTDSDLKAFCWDGLNSGLAVEYNGAIVTSAFVGGNVTDPDIAIAPFDNAFGERMILVAYEIGGSIYYERWAFNGSLLYAVDPSTLLFTTTPSPTCSNANVDIGTDGSAMIAYSNGANSLGTAIQDLNAPSLVFSAAIMVDIPCIPLCNSRYPDVKLSLDHDNGEMMASFVFIYSEGDWNNSVERYLAVNSVSMTDFFSGSIPVAPCPGLDDLYSTVAPQHSIGRPRIAGPPEMVNSSMDYEVVVKTVETSNDFEIIHGFTKSKVGGIPNVIAHHHLNTNVWDPFPFSPSNQLFQCLNRDPVVTSSFDHRYQTGWTFYKASSSCPSTPPGGPASLDIITRELTYNGEKIFPDFSVANTTVPGQQRVASLAGRYNNAAEFLYFFGDDQGNLFYKSIPVGNSTLRLQTTATEGSPIKEQLPENLVIDQQLQAASPTRVQLFALDGRLVMDQWLRTNGIMNLSVGTDAIYLLVETHSDGSHTSRKLFLSAD
ncbi:MAG: hypothetical protein ACFB10_21785 [Salibacteraceae bacterium]